MKRLYFFFLVNVIVFFLITSFIGYFEAPDGINHLRRGLELSIPANKLINEKFQNRGEIKGLSSWPETLKKVDSIHYKNILFDIGIKSRERKINKKTQIQMKEVLQSENMKNLTLDLKTNKSVRSHTLISYSGMNYLPQILAIKSSILLNLDLDKTFKLARNSNKILLFLISGYCIYLARNKNLLLPLFCLFFITLPTSLFLFSTISGDAGIIGSIMFFSLTIEKIYLSYCKRTFFQKNNIFILLELIFACLALAAISSKSTYIPLSISMGIIYFYFLCKNKYNYIKFLFLSGFSIGIINSIKWLNYTSEESINLFKYYNPSINPEYALIQVKTFSLPFLKSIFVTTYREIKLWIPQLIGILGPLNNKPLIHEFTYYCIFFVGLCSILFLTKVIFIDKKFYDKQKSFYLNFIYLLPSFILISSSISSIYLTFGSLWAVWTPFLNENIEGMQGRYFLPYLPIIILIFSLSRTKSVIDKLQNIKLLRILLLFGTLTNLIVFYTNISHYYIY